jgi:putative oxidoreductase
MNTGSDDSNNPVYTARSSRSPLNELRAPSFLTGIAPTLLRWVIALTLLSAVADRFGLWGPPGAVNVAWGDWTHFVTYTAKVNGFMPSSLAPALAFLATAAETLLALALILGIFPRLVAFASAALFVLFAAAMTASFGVKAPLNFSVFVDAAAAFALGAWPPKAQVTRPNHHT